jgi:hypothetical protein
LQLGGEVSLPVHVGWSELLFSPGGSYIATQLQLYLLSSSPSKVRQFSFEHYALSHEISSGIHHLPHFEMLAFHPTPTLSLCVSSALCSVLAAIFGGWFVALHCCQTLLLYLHSFIKSSALKVCLLSPTLFSRAGSEFHPNIHCQYRIRVHCLCFSGFFFWEGAQSAQGLCWIMFPRGG